MRRATPRLVVALAVRTAVIAGMAVAVAGCTSVRDWLANGLKVGPNYGRPPAPVAETWIDGNDPRVASSPAQDASWWRVFGDPVLDDLVANAYRQNLPLKEAGFRVLAERAKLAIAVGQVFPQTQQAFGEYMRKGLSAQIANSQFTPDRWFNIVDLGFNLSWEVDVWGKLRRNVEANRADFNASIEDYDGVLVTLISDVAQTYTQIRTLQTQIVYTKQNVELQRQTLALVKDRYEGGAVSKLDLTQAMQNLADTEALLPPLYISLRQANDRLCALLSIPMEDLEKAIGGGAIPKPPTSVAVGIPADLIRQRPDVRSAERQLAAQSARIGVAEADLYPLIAITGTVGTMARSVNDLFENGTWFGTWGPSFQWNILNYGRLLNQIRVQDARFQELAAAYFNKVVTADEEVENALALFLQTQTLVQDLERAVAAARESADIALVQYREGKTDYIRVFIIERELTTQMNNLAIARGDMAQGLIAIYRALGGGWQIRCTQPSPPTDTAGQELPPAKLAPPTKLDPPTPLSEPWKTAPR
jgi:NodT family efflux transporter outer membrane factor (OMF) lipoprotein